MKYLFLFFMLSTAQARMAEPYNEWVTNKGWLDQGKAPLCFFTSLVNMVKEKYGKDCGKVKNIANKMKFCLFQKNKPLAFQKRTNLLNQDFRDCNIQVAKQACNKKVDVSPALYNPLFINGSGNGLIAVQKKYGMSLCQKVQSYFAKGKTAGTISFYPAPKFAGKPGHAATLLSVSCSPSGGALIVRDPNYPDNTAQYQFNQHGQLISGNNRFATMVGWFITGFQVLY